jgi:hypothetical protein
MATISRMKGTITDRIPIGIIEVIDHLSSTIHVSANTPDPFSST